MDHNIRAIDEEIAGAISLLSGLALEDEIYDCAEEVVIGLTVKMTICRKWATTVGEGGYRPPDTRSLLYEAYHGSVCLLEIRESLRNHGVGFDAGFELEPYIPESLLSPEDAERVEATRTVFALIAAFRAMIYDYVVKELIAGVQKKGPN